MGYKRQSLPAYFLKKCLKWFFFYIYVIYKEYIEREYIYTHIRRDYRERIYIYMEYT